MDYTKTEPLVGSPDPMPASEGKGETAKYNSESQEINLRQQGFEGLPSNRCRRCSRVLTAKASRAHGYGSKCFQRVRYGDLKRAKKLEQVEPRTITDTIWAERSIQAIYSLVRRIPLEDAGFNGRCGSCGTTIHEMPVESYDHGGGVDLPGFGKKQWVYLHDDHNDLAIWKIRIHVLEILEELERVYPGQVPVAYRPAVTGEVPAL